MYLVRFDEGPMLECSGAAAALAYLRQGAALVAGDRAALAALAEAQQAALLRGLRGEDEAQPVAHPPVVTAGQGGR